MSFLKSNKIKVFPATGRSEDYEDSYLTTEDNLTTINKAIFSANNYSWVINTEVKIPFKFILNGYSFEINDISVLVGNLYATIYLKKELVEGDYQRLVNEEGTRILDSNDEFTGLSLSTSSPTKINTEEIESFSLQLLENGEIPNSSKISIFTSSVFDKDTYKALKEELNTTNIKATTSTIESEAITTSNIKDLTISNSLTSSGTSSITNESVKTSEIENLKITKTLELDGKIVSTIPQLDVVNESVSNKLTTKDLETTGETNLSKLNVSGITSLGTTTISTLNATTINSTNGKITGTSTLTNANITKATINNEEVTTSNIKDLTISNSLKSANSTITQATITKANITNEEVNTSSVKTLTITDTLKVPTNFYGKYTITFANNVLTIKENY